MIKRIFGAALVTTCGYAVADSVADSLMYYKCRRMVETRAAAHSALQSALGNPLSAGPWYNATVQITHDGHIATVTIPLHGEQRSSDVTVRVVRRGGLRSTLLYNLFGAAEWDAIVMQAVIGMGPGGIPQSMSVVMCNEGYISSADGRAALTLEARVLRALWRMALLLTSAVPPVCSLLQSRDPESLAGTAASCDSCMPQHAQQGATQP